MIYKVFPRPQFVLVLSLHYFLNYKCFLISNKIFHFQISSNFQIMLHHHAVNEFNIQIFDLLNYWVVNLHVLLLLGRTELGLTYVDFWAVKSTIGRDGNGAGIPRLIEAPPCIREKIPAPHRGKIPARVGKETGMEVEINLGVGMGTGTGTGVHFHPSPVPCFDRYSYPHPHFSVSS